MHVRACTCTHARMHMHTFVHSYHSSSTKITNTTKNDTLFEEWSETEVVIAGGDAASHASLWQNGSYKHAQVEAWESTVKVPCAYLSTPRATQVKVLFVCV